jgi:hypothetical protein
MGTRSASESSNRVQRELHQTLMIFLLSSSIVIGFDSAFRIVRMFVKIENENLCTALNRADDMLMSLLPAFNAAMYSFRSRQFKKDLANLIHSRKAKSEETTKLSALSSSE